jgi:hypothetical protein
VIILDECEIIAFVSAFACSISKCYTDDELNLLAAIFTQLGDSLNTITARRALCDNNTADSSNQNVSP